MLILVNDLVYVKRKGWKSVEWAKGNLRTLNKRVS